MIDPKFIDDLTRRVANNLPSGLQVLQEDLQRNIRSALEAGLGHLELVTREEFELQRAVLARTREKLERLEKQLENLEQGNRKES
jgi:BMFP domain-containing protein YqiC